MLVMNVSGFHCDISLLHMPWADLSTWALTLSLRPATPVAQADSLLPASWNQPNCLFKICVDAESPADAAVDEWWGLAEMDPQGRNLGHQGFLLKKVLGHQSHHFMCLSHQKVSSFTLLLHVFHHDGPPWQKPSSSEVKQTMDRTPETVNQEPQWTFPL